MSVWYQKYLTEEFRKQLWNYFDTKFSWRFDDPKHAFDEIWDIVVLGILPRAKIRHQANTLAYVYTCFGNATRDYGDKQYSKITVPEQLASRGKRYRRLFWDFCLNRRSVQDLSGYCELPVAEVRTWTGWLTRGKKCPKSGVHSAVKSAGEPTDPDAAEVAEHQQGPFENPDDDYRKAQQKYYLHLWCEERLTPTQYAISERERKLQAQPRPSLSITEKNIMRCWLKEMTVAETAELLGMQAKEQQIRNARNNLSKRIRKFCEDNNIEF